ncbi:MAG TPA: MSMEG_4193 family putative phosphomutase [Actinomycetota bacterium]|nr:MSMEG_4193 family putative phosphomutase [Actinomycetota bacterium]
MTTLLLIRHGRSEANAQGILAGRNDTPLDGVGRDEALDLGRRLAHMPLDMLVSSPQLRARQTAQIAAAGRGEVVVDEAFAECDYGQWSGRSLRDLVDQPEWVTVQTHPSAARFPGGETMAQMAHRASQGARALVTAHPDRTVWVVTHGDVIKAVLADALGLHVDHFQRIVVDTASVSLIRYTPSRPFVEKINDTGTLRPARNDGSGAADAVVGGRTSQ